MHFVQQNVHTEQVIQYSYMYQLHNTAQLAKYCKVSLKVWHIKIYLEEALHRSVFKEEINLVYNTFACFHVFRLDLWTAGEKPPGTVSSFICLSLSLHIWLRFGWSKPTCHYEINANENTFSAAKQALAEGKERVHVDV